MRRLSILILSALLLAASPVRAIDKPGEPHVLIKAFLLKTDKTFDHATSWCGYDSICTFTVGDYEVGLGFFMGNRNYRLRVASWDGDNPCCFFSNGFDETSVEGIRPHAEVLYYKTAAGRVKLGTLYIALESLK